MQEMSSADGLNLMHSVALHYFLSFSSAKRFL